MGDRSDAEWGTPYDEAESPRRDRVPEPGFSRPSDVDPEITYLVPEFRAKRVRTAKLVSWGIGLFVLAIAVRLVVWRARADLYELREGLIAFYFVVGCAIVGAVAVVLTWRWALARDRRDLRRNP